MTTGGGCHGRPWQDVPSTAGVAAVSVALLAGPLVGGAVTGPRPVVAALVLAVLTQAVGRAVTPWLRLPATVPAWLVATVVGYAVASGVQLGSTAGLSLTVGAAFPVALAFLAILVVVARRWRPRGLAMPTETARSWHLQVAGLLVCVVLSTVWTRETVRAVPAAQSQGVFPAWQDYFLHGAEVSYLRDYPAYEGRSQYLTAVPQPLYHRGSFALAAVFSWIAGVPSLDTATMFWLPAGMLLVMCAVLACGAALGGPLAALGALAAVFLVPDASHYGAMNHFLSFEWLMQMAAGSGYGLAVAMTAVTVLVSTAGPLDVRTLVVAGTLVAMSALFRVQIAVLAAVTLAWYAALTWRPRISRGGLAAAMLSGLGAAGALWWMETLSLAPHFLSGSSAPGLFFLSVHTQANNLPSVFRAWWATHGVAADVAFGFPLMLWAGLGVWLVMLPFLAMTRRLARLGRGARVLPVAVVAASLTVILAVPTPAPGDPTDFGHRSFVLVYVVFVGLTGAALGRLAASRTELDVSYERRALAIAGALAAIMVVVPWRLSGDVQQRWVPEYATMIVPPEAFQAAAYVRAHAGAGDQVLAADEDHYAIYVALTERRAWLSRASLYQQLGPDSTAAVNARLAAHAGLAAAPTWAGLVEFGRRNGIAWYIANAPATHQWPADVVDRCAYCGSTVRVYDLR